MGRGGTPAREISFVSLVAYGPNSDSALTMGVTASETRQGGSQQYYFPKLNQDDAENMNRIITTHDFEAVINKFSVHKIPKPNDFTILPNIQRKNNSNLSKTITTNSGGEKTPFFMKQVFS